MGMNYRSDAPDSRSSRKSWTRRGRPVRRWSERRVVPRKAKPARSLRKEMGSKSKSNKLVCRYCGSDDLAPSFIKRRDRRCRKCFIKRYGSAARAGKGKGKKKPGPRVGGGPAPARGS